MYEVSRKFKIHPSNIRPLLDRLNHVKFNQTNATEQKIWYLSGFNKNRVIKLVRTRKSVGDNTVKNEYFLSKKNLENYETPVKKIVKTIMKVSDTELTKPIGHSMISLASQEIKLLPILYRLRRTFEMDKDVLTANKMNQVIVNFDEVQGLGQDFFVKFKVFIDSVESVAEAKEAIKAVMDNCQPFVGEFEADYYLNLLIQDQRDL